MSARALALGHAAAVLGDGASVWRAAALAGLGTEEAERAADALAAAGIIASERPLRFVHPAVRATLYDDLAPGARAVAHRRAVALLVETGAAAVHALVVEPAADALVARALVDAARAALGTGAPGLAARLLQRALAEPPPPEAGAAARALLGVAYGRLNDRRAAGLLREALADGALASHHRFLSAHLADALWLTGDARAALDVLGSTTTDLAPGVAAAVAARAGSAPAATIAQRAQLGLDGDTAFERCCAVAALIACDEPDAACRALAAQAARATANGARAELNMIASLWARMVAVARATPEPTQLLPGPDPGPSPWEAWLDDPAAVERFAAPSARAAAHRSAAGDASGEARIELLELGVAALRHSPRRAVLAQALAELGRALRHLGRRAAARSTLREALDISQRLGLGRVAAQATEELRVAGARPRRERLSGPESLTAAERRVAEVAALGLTNRDIAAQLFLSPKTVEMHLGRVYRKLDIASRVELVPVLADARLPAAA